jgi:hypothetical protein
LEKYVTGRVESGIATNFDPFIKLPESGNLSQYPHIHG